MTVEGPISCDRCVQKSEKKDNAKFGPQIIGHAFSGVHLLVFYSTLAPHISGHTYRRTFRRTYWRTFRRTYRRTLGAPQSRFRQRRLRQFGHMCSIYPQPFSCSGNPGEARQGHRIGLSATSWRLVEQPGVGVVLAQVGEERRQHLRDLPRRAKQRQRAKQQHRRRAKQHHRRPRGPSPWLWRSSSTRHLRRGLS